jgi:glycosyltransferase involved in cell wall biosynthesis
MVIVQINSECGRGSTGKIVCSISKVLTENQIDNYIFYSGNHKSSFPNSIQINGKLSIRIHQVLSRIFGDQGFHSYFSTKRMIKKIEKISPDAILLHNIHGYYLHIGVLFRFLKRYDRPIYWTLHDCWAFTGHCTHFALAKCDRWKAECGNCPCLKKYPYSWFFDRSAKLLEKKKKLYGDFHNLHIITPSKWLAGLVKQSFLQDFNVTVINNGIDISVFKYTDSSFKHDHGIEDKKMILGVASVWSYAKGLDIFIELSKARRDWAFVLVGTDDKTDKLLPKQIISIHRTSNQTELAKIYSAADVFLNPTREDTFPTVNMEAIACGTPVVTFDTGGSAEIVGDKYGAVCKDCCADGVISVIEDCLYKQKEGSLIIGDTDKFDEQICFDNYISLMRKMK